MHTHITPQGTTKKGIVKRNFHIKYERTKKEPHLWRGPLLPIDRVGGLNPSGRAFPSTLSLPSTLRSRDRRAGRSAGRAPARTNHQVFFNLSNSLVRRLAFSVSPSCKAFLIDSFSVFIFLSFLRLFRVLR